MGTSGHRSVEGGDVCRTYTPDQVGDCRPCPDRVSLTHSLIVIIAVQRPFNTFDSLSRVLSEVHSP